MPISSLPSFIGTMIIKQLSTISSVVVVRLSFKLCFISASLTWVFCGVMYNIMSTLPTAKPRKPRIFIVGSTNNAGDRIKKEEKKEDILLKNGHSPQKGKRKHLFAEINQRKNIHKKQYEYNLDNHIHTEPVVITLNCDFMGCHSPQTQALQKEQKKEETIQLKPPKEINNLKQERKTQILLANSKNNLIQESPAKAPPLNRVKIFEGTNYADFRPNTHLSCLSGTRRRSIFFRHESQQSPISLNASLSHTRRRIFSTDHHQRHYQPVLPPELQAENPNPKMTPIQSVIKQEEEPSASRITHRTTAIAQESPHPPNLS